MDAFEVRLQFISLLRKLNASQQSIQKVVTYALKHFSKSGEDLWSCIMDECRDGSLNVRINILYLLDTLCESSLQTAQTDRVQGRHSSTSGTTGSYYIHYVNQDLEKIIDYVVPDSKDGLMNVQSTSQILENWRIKRILDVKVVDSAISTLETRKTSIQEKIVSSHASKKGATQQVLSRGEVIRRIEEDRERHKRLRERRWVQQIDRSDATAQTLATFLPILLSGPLPPQPVSEAAPSDAPVDAMEVDVNGTNVEPEEEKEKPTITEDGDNEKRQQTSQPIPPQFPIDIEFENAWETTSDWNDDDIEAVGEEAALCFPSQ